MGHLYGTCVGQIPIWNTYVGQVFIKYIVCVKYMGHVCENTYMVHICGTFFDKYIIWNSIWAMYVTNMHASRMWDMYM